MSSRRPVRMGSAARWQPSTTQTAGLLLGAAVLLAGALTGRADVAALGVAPLVGGAWGWARRPTTPLEVELHGLHQRAGTAELRATVLLRPPPGMHAALLRASSSGSRASERLVHVARGAIRAITVGTVSTRTGARPVFQVDVVGLGAERSVASDVVTVGPATVVVLPVPRRLAELPLPPRLQGLVGLHEARRIGESSELHDVDRFVPGDRLRRIDWRASARRGMVGDRLQDLYVRRTQSTAEATVVLVIDSRDDVGPDVGTWAGGRAMPPGAATSLDRAREAAASLARAYLAQGDRVGLEDLGLGRRPVAPSGGRRHLQRIMRQLALATPERSTRPRARAPQMPAGALVIVLSTFLDDEARDLALLWRRTGHRVVVVDVLPTISGFGGRSEQSMSFRLVALQRENRFAALRRVGVPMVRWDEEPVTRFGARAQLAVLARHRHGGKR